jgi:hypothetical protein
MEAALQGQMLRPYFPVNMSLLAAARAFTEVKPGSRWPVEDASVEAVPLNHPQGCLGFRIETSRGVVVYASDNEPGDPKGDEAVRYLARGADLLIYDAQYSPAMLRQRRGWGHSSWLEGVAVAKSAGARALILFHHDPDSDDATVGRFVQMAREHWPETGSRGGAPGRRPNAGGYVREYYPPRRTGDHAASRPGAGDWRTVPPWRRKGSDHLTLTGTYVVLPTPPAQLRGRGPARAGSVAAPCRATSEDTDPKPAPVWESCSEGRPVRRFAIKR